MTFNCLDNRPITDVQTPYWVILDDARTSSLKSHWLIR